ncbi:uncharacterized protein LOC117639678 [Thrips palmi]|uniref:Gustatory receptor n=1 Tax=Thrips palmi TaxID=161013 RepID=A0A6P8Y4S6_THRPL|nr:uncharacterized protein LOC117639678 [Thrips palmi]
MTVSSLAFLVGSFRKAALLPGLLAHPLTAAPRCQPRTAAIVAQLGVLVVGYCVLGAGFLLSSPEVRKLIHTPHSVRQMDPAVKKVSTASCVLFAMSAVEKLSMNHMVRRVGRRFAAINDDLGEAHSVVAARSGMHAERRGPQVTQRVAEARAQHKECCCMLAALTRCFEAQLVGILVMDFFVLLASVFLAILLLMHDATIPSLLVASSTNGSFCITGTFLLARTCHLAGREARRAHTSVHAVLNLPHVGPEEVRELKAFSFQLLHAKTSVTPFQMFTVDYSLISTLSVGFFTYSIMVGQFGLVGSKNLEGYYGNGTDAPNTTAMLDFATSGDR